MHATYQFDKSRRSDVSLSQLQKIIGGQKPHNNTLDMYSDSRSRGDKQGSIVGSTKQKVMKRVPSKHSQVSNSNTTNQTAAVEHMFKRRQATLLSLASAAQISHRSNITSDPQSTVNAKVSLPYTDQNQVSSFGAVNAGKANEEEYRNTAPVQKITQAIKGAAIIKPSTALSKLMTDRFKPVQISKRIKQTIGSREPTKKERLALVPSSTNVVEETTKERPPI